MVTAPTTSKESPEAPDFHVWLRGHSDSAGRLKADRALGLYDGYLKQLLRLRQLPRENARLVAVAEHFGASPELIEAWSRAADERRAARYKRNGEMKDCLKCGSSFYVIPSRLQDEQHGFYCSRSCAHLKENWDVRTPFQRAIVGAYRKSGETFTGFCASNELVPATIRKYLEEPTRHPLRQIAEKLAPAIDKTVDELEEMCGGFDNARRRAGVLRLPRRGIRASKETRRKMSAAKKGRPFSDEVRQAQSKRVKAALEDPATRAKLVEALARGQTLESRIKKLSSRYGRDHVRGRIDILVERYALEFKLSPRSVRSIIQRVIGDKVAPRAGKVLPRSRSGIIRAMSADGKTMPQIVQEGLRRQEAGEKSWTYKYAHKVLGRAEAS